jgi:hypothetical protein
MSVKIPQPFVSDSDVDLSGSLTTTMAGGINANLTGIPSHLTLTIDHLPKIQLGIDPVEIKPLDLSLRIKEMPSMRVHLPADFCVGLSILGAELLTVRLCGKAMAITEPYHPNPCEVCGAPASPNNPGTVGVPPRLTIGGN